MKIIVDGPWSGAPMNCATNTVHFPIWIEHRGFAQYRSVRDASRGNYTGSMYFCWTILLGAMVGRDEFRRTSTAESPHEPWGGDPSVCLKKLFARLAASNPASGKNTWPVRKHACSFT
jgi:hypothetical protein